MARPMRIVHDLVSSWHADRMGQGIRKTPNLSDEGDADLTDEEYENTRMDWKSMFTFDPSTSVVRLI